MLGICYGLQLIANSLDELGKAELLTILLTRDIVVQPDQFDDAIIKDTIETIIQMKHIQRKKDNEHE